MKRALLILLFLPAVCNLQPAACSAASPAPVAKVELEPGRTKSNGRPHVAPPTFHEVKIKGRDRTKLKEWRDQKGNYAIFWTARSDKFAVYQILGSEYAPLARTNTRAQSFATLHDATKAANGHWQLLAGGSKFR